MNPELVSMLVAAKAGAFAALNVTGPSANGTEPTAWEQSCGWFQLYDLDKGKCVQAIGYSEIFPGVLNMWRVYCSFFPIVYAFFVLAYSHALHRHIVSWNPKLRRPWYGSAITYSLIGCIFSSLCMCVSTIDGWAFFGYLPVRAYLVILCLAYGTLPTSAIIIPAFDMMDNRILSPKRSPLRVSKGYSVVILILLVLAAIYCIVGYTIFGNVLASVLLKDPETKLAREGTYLVYAIYTICLVTIMVTVLPVLSELWEKMNSRPKNASIAYYIDNVQAWACVCFLACGANLAILVQRNALSDKSLYDTLNQLQWTRIFECVILFVTLRLFSSQYVERWWMLELWTKPLLVHVFGFDFGPIYGQKGDVTSEYGTVSIAHLWPDIGSSSDTSTNGGDSVSSKPRRSNFSRTSVNHNSSAIALQSIVVDGDTAPHSVRSHHHHTSNDDTTHGDDGGDGGD
jgi:hypothetical protein